MSRQKAIAFTIRGHALYDGKKFGSAGEAEQKILAAKDAAIACGVEVTDFAAHHTSIEVAADVAPTKRA